MTNFLNHYTVDENRPLDPLTIHILSAVNRAATELEIPYLVVGATARDLLLFHVFKIPVTRATADVDFAMAVDSWERFRQLRTALLAGGDFRETKVEHRIYLEALLGTEEIPVDLIPFGGVAESGLIHWPPGRETVMTVAGFEDALQAAVRVQIADKLIIPVASLAGLAMLKIFAWFDRQTTDKDALDLYRIITTYADAGNSDRLYGEEIRFLEQANYDLELAGAALLGFDTRQLCSAETLAKIRSLLNTGNSAEKLAERIRLSRFALQPEQLSKIYFLLENLNQQLTI